MDEDSLSLFPVSSSPHVEPRQEEHVESLPEGIPASSANTSSCESLRDSGVAPSSPVSPKASNTPTVPEVPHRGYLDLTPISFEDYLDLPVSSVGRYDRIEGLLVARDMPNVGHDIAVEYLKEVFHEQKRRYFRDTRVVALAAPVVCIPPGGTERNPDLGIGTQAEGYGAAFPVGNPPEVVVEVTSHNRNRDLDDKPRDYARAGVSRYLIIDRDIPHEGKRSHQPTVLVGDLSDKGRYEFREISGNETFDCRFLGRVTARQLLSPPPLGHIMVTNAEEETRRLKHERNGRVQAEQRRVQAEEGRLQAEQRRVHERNGRVQAEEGLRRKKEKLKEVRQKRSKYKQQLRGLGVPVSPSSNSSGGSPNESDPGPSSPNSAREV